MMHPGFYKGPYKLGPHQNPGCERFRTLNLSIFMRAFLKLNRKVTSFKSKAGQTNSKETILVS